MEKQIIEGINVITNDSKSKKVLIYFHGLDGSASFSKPLFKSLSEYKIVAVEQRGHTFSNTPSSRMIYKHLDDYLKIINHFKNKGYKVWILGESMGAAYCTILAFKKPNLVEGVFTQSIPNILVNIMDAPKWKQILIQFMTTISFLTNINWSYISSVNYEQLSSSKSLQRLAKIADKNKRRYLRETLATWAATKRAWRYIKNKKTQNKIYYFQPLNDVVVDIKKAKRNLINKKNIEVTYIKDAKHILMYEPQFEIVINKIKSVLN